MNTIVLVICGIIFSIVALWFFAQVFWRFVISYRVTDTALHVIAFHIIPIWYIRLDNINEIKTVAFRDFLPWNTGMQSFGWLNMGNRFYAPKGVLVEKKRGMIRKTYLTPDNPDAFVTEINNKIMK